VDSWLTLWGMTTTRPRRPTPYARRSTISPFDAVRATLDTASARMESQFTQLALTLDDPEGPDPVADLALLRRRVRDLLDAVSVGIPKPSAGPDDAQVSPGPSGSAG